MKTTTTTIITTTITTTVITTMTTIIKGNVMPIPCFPAPFLYIREVQNASFFLLIPLKLMKTVRFVIISLFPHRHHVSE